MKAIAGIAVAALMIAACTGNTPVTTESPGPLSPAPSTGSGQAFSPESGKGVAETKARPPSTGPGQALPEAGRAEEGAVLLLEIAEPEDEGVVRAAQITVSGRTAPDAVVTIDGRIVEVDGEGNFSETIGLEEGPNAIDVIASDFQGNRNARVLTVILAGG